MIIKFRENDSWVIFGEIDHIVYKEAFTVDEEKGSDDKVMNDEGRTVETF